MNTFNICMITDDVKRLVEFYERLFNLKAEKIGNKSGHHIPGLGISIFSHDEKDDLGDHLIKNEKGASTVGVNCEDAEMEYERILSLGICTPQKPHIWPWGSKSLSLNDPDGNIVMIRSWKKRG